MWAALAALPYAVVALGCLLARGATYVQGDLALLDVDAGRAGRFQQLLGPYDRFGWHHLGPAYAYLLAAAGWPAGAHHPLQAEALTAAVINRRALAGAALVARRVFGPGAAAGVLMAGAGLIISLGNDAVFNPWPPAVVIVPLLLLGVLTLAVLTGGSASLLTAGLVVGTFCVQTDLGTAPYAMALITVAGAGWAWRRRLEPEARAEPAGATAGLARAGLVAPLMIALIVLAWTPVAIQQITARRGNLSLVYDFFRSAHRHAGLAAGLRAAGWAQLAWFGHRPPAGPPVGWTGAVAVLVALLLAALLMAAGWWRRRPLVVGAAALWLGGTLVAVGAGAEIVGPAYSYLTIWAVAPLAAGCLGLGALLGTTGPALPHRLQLPVVLALAVSLAVTGDVLSRRNVSSYSPPAVGRAWALVAPTLTPKAAVGVAYANEGESWNIGTGLVDQLERSSHPVAVLAFWSNQVTDTARGAVSVWVNVLGPGLSVTPGQRYLGTVAGRRLVLATRPLVPSDAAY